MMNLMEVNIHQAKSQLSKLIERARNGDEVIIAKAGKPIVKLVPVERRSRRRRGCVFCSWRSSAVRPGKSPFKRDGMLP